MDFFDMDDINFDGSEEIAATIEDVPLDVEVDMDTGDIEDEALDAVEIEESDLEGTEIEADDIDVDAESSDVETDISEGEEHADLQDVQDRIDEIYAKDDWSSESKIEALSMIRDELVAAQESGDIGGEMTDFGHCSGLGMDYDEDQDELTLERKK